MLNYATVTGTFDDGQGQPLTGSATFTPSAALYASGVPVVTPDSPVQAQILSGQLLNAAGGPLQLLATDNAGVTVEGQTAFWFWTVTIQIGGTSEKPWSFFLPHTPSPVDLVSLSGGGSGGGFTNPMTTLGDLIYENATPAPARLPGNTTTASEFLNSTGSSGAATAPAWKQIGAADLARRP